MKKLGWLVFAILGVTAVQVRPAAADSTVYYCDLTGYGYASPDRDSYQFCMDNCYVVDAQNQTRYGECWLTPPPPPPPPGNPDQPPGGPSNQD
jgi:hypothetical protein